MTPEVFKTYFNLPNPSRSYFTAKLTQRNFERLPKYNLVVYYFLKMRMEKFI